MQHATLAPVSLPLPRKRRRPRWLAWLVTGVLTLLAAATLWITGGTPVVNLETEAQVRNSGIYADWAKGEVIVLVRHAERCDASDNPCLGDPTGITLVGSEAATQVGDGLRQLGLEKTDLLTSPRVRTRQTAHFMFGQLPASEDWLKQCNKTFAGNALAHKAADRNLVLVTHSGCIDHLERQLGVRGGERSSDYADALFVSVGSSGAPRILGKMAASQWRQLLASAPH